MKKFIFAAIILSLSGLATRAQEHPSNYNRISMSFRNTNFTGLSGFIGGAFNYTHGFGLSTKLPLYLETGISIAYVTKNEDGSSSWDAGYGSIEVPINCSYRIALPSEKAFFFPFIGLNVKGNVIGSSSMSSDTQEWYKDYDFKRVQLGWQIGAGLSYKKLYIGLSFGTDFIQIAKKVNTNTLNVSIGLNI